MPAFPCLDFLQRYAPARSLDAPTLAGPARRLYRVSMVQIVGTSWLLRNSWCVWPCLFREEVPGEITREHKREGIAAPDLSGVLADVLAAHEASLPLLREIEPLILRTKPKPAPVELLWERWPTAVAAAAGLGGAVLQAAREVDLDIASPAARWEYARFRLGMLAGMCPQPVPDPLSEVACAVASQLHDLPTLAGGDDPPAVAPAAEVRKRRKPESPLGSSWKRKEQLLVVVAERTKAGDSLKGASIAQAFQKKHDRDADEGHLVRLLSDLAAEGRFLRNDGDWTGYQLTDEGGSHLRSRGLVV